MGELLDISAERSREFHRIRVRKYKERHFALGLCADCPLPAQKPHSRCAKHHREANERSREHGAMKKENGCCTRCYRTLHPQMDADRSTCMECRETMPRHYRAIRF